MAHRGPRNRKKEPVIMIAIKSYADITTAQIASEYVQAMLDSTASIAESTGVTTAEARALATKTVRDEAQQMWERTKDAVTDDADERNCGASLVILTLNRLAGIQN